MASRDGSKRYVGASGARSGPDNAIRRRLLLAALALIPMAALARVLFVSPLPLRSSSANVRKLTDAAAAAPYSSSSASPLSTEANYVVAYCTVPDSDVGQRVVSRLVSSKLAACVNTVPGVQSSYWWEGRVETDSEQLLIIKTKRALQREVVDAIREVHSYDVPEVIFLSVEAGLSAYMQWLGESTKQPSSSSSSS